MLFLHNANMFYHCHVPKLWPKVDTRKNPRKYRAHVCVDWSLSLKLQTRRKYALNWFSMLRCMLLRDNRTGAQHMRIWCWRIQFIIIKSPFLTQATNRKLKSNCNSIVRHSDCNHTYIVFGTHSCRLDSIKRDTARWNGEISDTTFGFRTFDTKQ